MALWNLDFYNFDEIFRKLEKKILFTGAHRRGVLHAREEDSIREFFSHLYFLDPGTRLKTDTFSS